MVGPVALNQDLRSLPYVAPNAEIEEKRLTRYPHPEIPSPTNQSDYPRFETLVKQIAPPTPKMPAPLWNDLQLFLPDPSRHALFGLQQWRWVRLL